MAKPIFLREYIMTFEYISCLFSQLTLKPRLFSGKLAVPGYSEQKTASLDSDKRTIKKSSWPSSLPENNFTESEFQIKINP